MQRNMAATYPPWAKACRSWEGVNGRRAAKKKEQQPLTIEEESSSSSSESLSSSANPSSSSSSTSVTHKCPASKSAGTHCPTKRSRSSGDGGAKQAARKEMAASRAQAHHPDPVVSNTQQISAGVPCTVTAVPAFANLPTNYMGMTDVAKEALQLLEESLYLIPFHTNLHARVQAILQTNGPMPPNML